MRGLVRRILWILLIWLGLVALPSLGPARRLMALPLVSHDDGARGDLAYVLGGGYATEERLRAAADLYHQHRVARVWIPKDLTRSRYSYRHQRSLDRTEWAVAYLDWLGVPRRAIKVVWGQPSDLFDTVSEARAITRDRPLETERIVLVTSAAHTRRALLAFRHTLPPDVSVTAYAATSFKQSAEQHRPLWVEYGKLAAYWIRFQVADLRSGSPADPTPQPPPPETPAVKSEAVP